MTIFVSHSSTDATTVRALVDNLESAGGRVWLDQDLTGGEAWWSAILNQIRGCSVFVFALSENSLNSEACLLELKYARDLGRAILPVQIGDLPGLRDHIIFSYQSIDYRQPTASAGIALARAVHEREQNVPPLPDPLPDPPPIPYEYLMLLGTAIQGRTPLSFNEQDSIVRQLRQALRDEKNETILGNVRSLLKTLRQRPEVTFVTVNEINALLGDDAPAAQAGQQPVAQQQPVQQPANPQPTPEPARPAAGWYPDPAGGPQPRYWDGQAWAQPQFAQQPAQQFVPQQQFAPQQFAGQQFGGPPKPPSKGFSIATYVCTAIALAIPFVGIVAIGLGIAANARKEPTGRTAMIVAIVVTVLAWIVWGAINAR